MSQPDLVALAIAIFIPLALVARHIVRASRHELFSQGELVVVVGAIAVGLAAVLIYGTRSLVAFVPPVLMVVAGLYLTVATRAGLTTNRLARISGILAVIAGAAALIVLLLRAQDNSWFVSRGP